MEDNRKSLLAAIKSIGVKKSTFSADGTTVKGLEEAVNSLAGSKSDNGKYIVLLSDDDMKYKKDVLQTAKKNNIKLFACNIANKNSFTNTRKMIQEVGGYYYQAVKHDSIRLSLLHSNIMVKDGVNTKDSDGDGVDDFAEMNGSHIFAYDFFDNPAFTLLMESNPSMKDTDEDGYDDGYYEVKSTYMENGVIKESGEIVLLSHDDKIIEKTVINGLDELMKCAIEYTENLNYMTDYRALQYMRYMTYSEYAGQGSNISNLDWIITAGRVELAFIKYVGLRTDLRLRFNKSWTFKDKEGNLIDGAHMMATLSSYYLWKYNFSYVPSPIPSLFNFRSLNNMAGWAGDLHTFMAMRIRKKG